jgi:hypothetical protein
MLQLSDILKFAAYNMWADHFGMASLLYVLEHHGFSIVTRYGTFSYCADRAGAEFFTQSWINRHVREGVEGGFLLHHYGQEKSNEPIAIDYLLSIGIVTVIVVPAP